MIVAPSKPQQVLTLNRPWLAEGSSLGGACRQAAPSFARPNFTFSILNFQFSILLCLAAFLLAVRSCLAADPSREYQVKAVFLFNFAQFTEWPSNAFTAPDSPIVIGTLGNNPFGDYLRETVKNEVVRGRKIVVEHYQKVEEIKNCHILYIGQSEADRLEHDLNVLKGRPVLIVSDIENAAYRGVMIRLLTQSNKVRFRINLEETRAAGLTLSSKLLRLAEVIHPDRK
jgi:hypothetical protein